MSNYAPLGSNWLPWHFQRIYNFSEYLKLNGYFLNYGYSIWSSCADCNLDSENWLKKIYFNKYFISNLPYIFINQYFGGENLKLFGHWIDKSIIFFSGLFIAELFINLSKKKGIVNFVQALIVYIFFIINPWTYKMLIAHWVQIYFVFFFLAAIFLFLKNKFNIGLLFLFIAGLFDYQSSTGIAVYCVLILLILNSKKKQDLIKGYLPSMSSDKLKNYKIIIFFMIPIFLYFVLKFYAVTNLGIEGGSSILKRIGISGNDIHNGGLIGALQFLGGNRITQCIVNFNQGLDIKNLTSSIFLYNCILSTLSMFLISLISIFGLFIFYKTNNSFFKLIIFPLLFLLLSYLFLLQQSASVHLMGYSYLFSIIFSVGIASVIFKILKKYNFSVIAITLTAPIVIGIMLLCIRVSMLTGING